MIVVTFTGLYFCFPAAIGRVTVIATGGNVRQALAEAETPDRLPMASVRPIMTVDETVQAARRALPAEALAGYMSLPYKAGATYSVTGYYRGALPFSQLVRVSLDPRSGEVLGYTDTTRQMRGLRVVQYFFTVHFGSFGGRGWFGTAVKILWFLLGIVLALVAITGLLMYWNRLLGPLFRGSVTRRRTVGAGSH